MPTYFVRHLLFMGLAVLAGCVSSTLDSADFQTTKPSTQLTGDGSSSAPRNLAAIDAANSADTVNLSEGAGVQDPIARRDAVLEMRQKANETSGEKTKIGSLPQTAAEQLTPTDQQALARDLQQTANDSQATVTDEELAAKQASINLLRKKAQSHYKDAISTIEK